MAKISEKQLVKFIGEAEVPKLDPARTALISVDLQYFDAHPDWGEGKTAKDLDVEYVFDDYYKQLDTIMPKVQKLLSAFRKKGIEVMHLTVSEVTNDSRDVGYKQLVRGLICPADSKEAQLLDEVKAEGDEIVIKKSSSGVFPVTNFDRLLRNMNIETLVFAGTSTGGCVESAVRDAIDFGYTVYIVTDACAAGTIDSHELALWRLEGSTVFMRSTDEMISEIESLPTQDRKLKSGIERLKKYLPKPTRVAGENVDPYDLIFPPAIEHKYTRDNTVLVVIDVTRFAGDPKSGFGAGYINKTLPEELNYFYKKINDYLPNMKSVIDHCRAQEIKPIFIRLAGKSQNGLDLSLKYKKLGIQFGPGDRNAEWLPPVTPKDIETTLNKPGASIFNGTGLDEYLRNTGITNLIYVGLSYDYGIESSVRSATDRGYSVLVINDACVASHQRLQEELGSIQVGLVRNMSTKEFQALEIK